MNELKAVALKYPENAEAPFIAASGKKEMARRIIEIARENNIPLVKDVETADILSVQNPGELIPVSVYPVIAEVFALIRRIEKSYD
ncbi:MAG: EscU/YscU/HrcU family type III secretion system export apparatus switch protein [Treponema sp.]|nr:EscU/YscU/HrcU family type III secretion system export apparatus switch protein [Treponema sp.]